MHIKPARHGANVQEERQKLLDEIERLKAAAEKDSFNIPAENVEAKEESDRPSCQNCAARELQVFRHHRLWLCQILPCLIPSCLLTARSSGNDHAKESLRGKFDDSLKENVTGKGEHSVA